jgi:hypothetical protein
MSQAAPPYAPPSGNQAPPDFAERVQAAASQNQSLLKTLSETDYASGALYQNNQYLSKLQQLVKQQAATASKAHQARLKEEKDHEKYRDSTMKRFAYRLARKTDDFQAKAGKEEREFFDAVQASFEADKELERLKTELKDAEETRKQIETAKQTHDAAQAELDRLYAGLFDGPTPSFPNEDQAEAEVRQAAQAHDAVLRQLSQDKQVLQLLKKADALIRGALAELASAESASKMDMYGFGGSYADYAERSALSRAQMAVQGAKQTLNQANALNPNVGSIGNMRIAQGHFLSDIVFDNIFTDMRFHEEIVGSIREVEAGFRRLQLTLQTAVQSVQRGEQEAQRSGANIRQARERLQKARENIFERLAGGLPEYTP